MRYIAGLLQGCFMKTKINFIGSKSSPCLKEKSCQVWGYAVTRCSQNYRATQLSDHASCLSCLFFMFPPLPALWITGLLPDGMFKINCIIPLILWLQGLIPQTLPTLHKLPPPGITCLVWQVIVGRGGGGGPAGLHRHLFSSSENAAIRPPLRWFPLIPSSYLSLSQKCQECKQETLVLLCSSWTS